MLIAYLACLETDMTRKFDVLSFFYYRFGFVFSLHSIWLRLGIVFALLRLQLIFALSQASALCHCHRFVITSAPAPEA